MSMYLTYDLKGIQSFIFNIPKLKYIIGGSVIIDSFDRKEMPALKIPSECELIYSAAGKGVFKCDTKDNAERIKKSVLEKAEYFGLNIAFSLKDNYFDAVNSTDELYNYIPENLEGHPCGVSGLYPVGKNNKDREHHVVKRRTWDHGEASNDLLEQRLLEKGDFKIPPGIEGKIRFFRAMGEDSSEGRVALKAIGARNRWAVICMDGNDMGVQFRYLNQKTEDETEVSKYIVKMSKALDECTHYAASRGIQEVIRKWGADSDNYNSSRYKNEILLPVRPIAVGGDDIIVLCHSAYAMDFVREAIRAFNVKSAELHQEHGDLWNATGGELTISAGILYCSISIPLHSALNYTELLLASAKFKGRKHSRDGNPTPAAIDWEHITDGVLDTPASRRQRELIFKDKDKDEVIELTCRPYLNEDLEELFKNVKNLRSLPGVIRHKILPGLRQGYYDRQVFYAQMGKNYPEIVKSLNEENKNSSLWKVEKGRKSTAVIDALSLLLEEKRFSYTTAY